MIPRYYKTAAWKKLRMQCLQRDNFTCRYCGAPALQADHVVPRKQGGPDALHNLVSSCALCNKVAGGRRFSSFREKQTWVRTQRRRAYSGRKRRNKAKSNP